LRSRIGKLVELRGEQYLTCQEVITFLLDFLAHELEPDEERDFERHLALCPSCRAYLETYLDAVRLGRGAALRDEQMAPPLRSGDGLVRAILAAREA
jgi:anti-sigma factor RsiW